MTTEMYLRRLLARFLPVIVFTGVLLAGCSVLSGTEKSDSGDISMKVSIDDSRLELPQQVTRLTVKVWNENDRDMEVDIRADVIDGVHFLTGPQQTISDNQRVASRAGVPMRPGESREIIFRVSLDGDADPGTYYIDVEAMTPDQADVVEETVKIEVLAAN